MPPKASKPAHDLKAGQLSPDHFDLLIASTKIRGDGVINALRAHLVDGVPTKEACESEGVALSQFSRRRKALVAASDKACKLASFYSKSNQLVRALELQSAYWKLREHKLGALSEDEQLVRVAVEGALTAYSDHQ